MKRVAKAGWGIVAGLALALPATGVLSGCSGGSGGGGPFIPGVGANQFAGVQANGQLRNTNNQPVGTVAFQVDNNNQITGTLTSDFIAGNAGQVAFQVAARQTANKPRGTATNGTGTVNSDGTFVLNFNVRTTTNATGIVTLRGRLARNGNVVSAQDLTFESPFPGFSGTYDLNITLVVPNPGGGGNANASFSFGNVTATNANTGNFSANTATAIVIRNNNNQVTQLTTTFVQTATPLRTVTVTIGNGLNAIAPGNFTPGNGAAVSYTETDINTQQTRVWSSTGTGTVRLDSLSATQAQVTITGVGLSAQPIPNAPNPPTGTFTISGSGTSTIQ